MLVTINTVSGQVTTDSPLNRVDLDLAFILLEYAETQLSTKELQQKFRIKKTPDLDWDKFVKDYNKSNK